MSDPRPLLELAPGQAGTVVGCSAGRGLLGRFASMGFTPGSRVLMVNNYGRGPLLVIVHGARVALGRGEASRVLVRPEASASHA